MLKIECKEDKTKIDLKFKRNIQINSILMHIAENYSKDLELMEDLCKVI